MNTNQTNKVAVLGTTSWGTTLAILLARNGIKVNLLARTESEAKALIDSGENTRFTPGVTLPRSLIVTSSPKSAIENAQIIVIAVPSNTIRANIDRISSFIKPDAVLVSATKGLEVKTGMRMTEVLVEELKNDWNGILCALSGPNLAKEILLGKPSTTVIASTSKREAKKIQDVFNSELFRVYTNDDIVGVELGGALKNVFAIGAGICDGMKVGDNAKASFVTRGLAEMVRLTSVAGGNPLTIAGLAGVGDTIATCYSELSRNRTVGFKLATGMKLDKILKSMDQVAEGVITTAALVKLSNSLDVDMPITQCTYEILYEGLSIEEAVLRLLGRNPASEWD
ncbi:MAG: glycerol-3-phosphate dehydrogenase [Dehalococcoidia bacterium]|nr:glycerol-3-phosphate dehydrogenase [Dehalococcoidia bacterium]MQG15415.1 NAD(P)-dependent glycerol-3-phosphate dehydrogenase [SAR202 cluster bacterium]|tara:strand:- start:95564 stop:96583 length:1020 start_codon:yes stop_codon:yes gene_type:complete